jgi:hypothetical protein
MGLRKFIKTLRKKHAPTEKNPNESGLLSDLKFRSDKTEDGSLASKYRTDFGKPSMMDTDSSSEECQQAVFPNEFDDMGPVELSRVEEYFVDWLNDDLASWEQTSSAMPTWASSEATFQAWPDVPLPEANEERSDAALSQTIEPQHKVHKKTRVAALCLAFEPLPDVNEDRNDSFLSQKLESLPDADEEKRDADLPQTFEPFPDASEEQNDVVLSQKSEPQS